jgi:hypothetical protein
VERLLEASMELVKGQMVTCVEAEFKRLQGEAQSYQRLLRLIRSTPMELNNRGE